MTYRLSSLMMGFATVLSGLILIAPVQACSGGGTDTLEALLERSDIAVKAQPVAVDELRQNGVLRVEAYLYGGTGPAYLLFSMNDPAILHGILEGAPRSTCNFVRQTLTPGETGYYFLRRDADGVYRSTTDFLTPEYFTFDTPDTTLRFYTRDGDAFIDHHVREVELLALITDIGNSAIAVPAFDQPYPRLAPLKITTADGKHYLLPVDDAPPQEATPDLLRTLMYAAGAADGPLWNARYFLSAICPGPDCEQISPDGQNTARQWAADEVTWYSGSTAGQAFLFSSTSDTIAIWNQDQLAVYTLGDPRPDMDTTHVVQVNTVTLHEPPDQTIGQAAWSPDGRLLAYSDSAGLWLLDVFTPGSEPALLVAADGAAVPLAREFSPLGRYLYVTQGDERFTLDYVSGKRYPDGLVSPDDRLLLAFDTTAEVFALQLCPLVLDQPCDPQRGTSVYDAARNLTFYDQIIEVAWRDNYSYFALVCRQAAPADCVVDRRYNESGRTWRDSLYYLPGTAFDYQFEHDMLAVVQTGNRLLINDATIDLPAWLTEPIVRVEWLPSVFYQR